MPGLRVDVLRYRSEANRAAGFQFGGTDRPLPAADLQPGGTGRPVRPRCRSSGASVPRAVVGIEGACPVQGTGRPVMVRTLGTLDARATGRRVAGPMGANRAAGLQPGGTDRPAAVSIVGTWSTGRGWHRGACVARSRFTEGRVSARYQALRLPVAVSIDGERFATEGAACARCARCGVLASRGPAR